MAEFPEVSEFLEKMQVKKSLFGYDKEDVYLKIHPLNRLYQDRLLLVKGQAEAAREEAQAQAEQMLKEAREEAEQLRKSAREEREQLREQIRQEERAVVVEELGEKNRTLQKELELLEKELNRSAMQLKELRDRVNKMTENM